MFSKVNNEIVVVIVRPSRPEMSEEGIEMDPVDSFGIGVPWGAINIGNPR